MELFQWSYLVFLGIITNVRSQYSPIGFKLAEGGSSTVVQVPRPPQHPVFDEPKTFSYMEYDQMIPGYLVAVMNFTIVSVSPRGDIEYIFALNNSIILPQYKSTRTFIYKAGGLKRTSLGTFMQSSSPSNSSAQHGEILHIPLIYNHCIITFNRISRTVTNLSLPCRPSRDDQPTPAAPLSEFSFLWPKDILAKNTTENKSVLSFYVSSPWNHSISLVDLTTDNITDIYMCCSKEPGNGDCYKPSYMTLTPYYTLVVTTSYGIFELKPETGCVELLTNPNGFVRSNQILDGRFGVAQVGELGPLTSVPVSVGVFVFADRRLHNLRVMDLNTRHFYSLCLSSVDLYLTSSSTTGMTGISGELLPQCNLTSPYSVLFPHTERAILVSQAHSINSLSLSYVRGRNSHYIRSRGTTVATEDAGNDKIKGSEQTDTVSQNQCVHIDGPLSALYYNPELCDTACEISQILTCISSSSDGGCSKLVHTACPLAEEVHSTQSVDCNSLSLLSPPVYKHSWNMEIHTKFDVDGCLNFTYTCISFLFDLKSISDSNGAGSLLSLERLPYLSCKVSKWGLLLFACVPAILMAVIITLMVCDYKSKLRYRRTTTTSQMTRASSRSTCFCMSVVTYLRYLCRIQQ